MKKIIIAALLFTGCNIGQDEMGVPYRYEIKYQYGRWEYSDYTNYYEWLPNHVGISYVNENEDSIIRMGTFYIKPNR
jgi:hypothetical protein